MNKRDLTGKRFSRLIAIRELEERNASKKIMYECRCDCGALIIVAGCHLLSGHTKSCSCLQKEFARNTKHNVTHGLTKSSTYHIWSSMKRRCFQSDKNHSKYYYEKGISVCERWINSFENFVSDMGMKPDGDYSIDRIDNSKGYSPSNCRWATRIEQENNKSTNVIIEYNGNAMTLKQLSRLENISYDRLHRKVRRQKKSVYSAINEIKGIHSNNNIKF